MSPKHTAPLESFSQVRYRCTGKYRFRQGIELLGIAASSDS